MVKLHCYLAGFGIPDALQIESVADLVRSHLSAEWSFSTAGADACDLLLCDVGSAPGAAAWRSSAIWSGVRVAATDEDTKLGELALMKPLRVHGPGSLVHVLNEAAQLSMSPADPGLAASGPAVPGAARPAPAPGKLRSLLRTLPTWLSEPAARPPAPRSAQTPEALASTLPVEDGAEPAPGMHDILVSDTPARSSTADPNLAEPILAAAGVIDLHQPEGQLAPQASPAAAGNVVVVEAMGCDLLGLLRRAKTASEVIVVRLNGIPPICAVPAVSMCYTFATLEAVFDSPVAALAPAHVTVARTSHHGRAEVQTTDQGAPVSAPSFPLKDLFWVATLRCGGADEAAGYRDGAFSLLSWPNLASLPHAPHHIIWCSHLARRPMTAAALSRITEHDADEAAIFLAACDELGILVRKELPSGLPPTSPARTSRAPEHATVLRSLLNRLGLKRP